MEYIQKALKINPNSPRARRGMQWAMQRLRDTQGLAPGKENSNPLPQPKGSGGKTGPKRNLLYPILLLGLGCLVCGAVAWSVSTSPVFASIIEKPVPAAAPTQAPSWAHVEIPKPTYTSTALFVQQMAQLAPLSTPAPSIVEGPTLVPAEPPTTSATDVPTETVMESPTEVSVPSPQPTWSGSLSIEYVADTPTAKIPTSVPASAHTSQPNYAPSGGEHWIDVNLSQQMVYAYEGNTVVNSFLVSTGTWMYPTVTGQYHIYVKLRYTDMVGPDYYLPNVPYTMYFYKGYGLHGTYWHHNFGTPMSHGCINLSIPDSEWLYNFASVGTLVNIHY
jgi:lipoprotein-anchoring transpeptidase ErfK/SrfK